MRNTADLMKNFQAKFPGGNIDQRVASAQAAHREIASWLVRALLNDGHDPSAVNLPVDAETAGWEILLALHKQYVP